MQEPSADLHIEGDTRKQDFQQAIERVGRDFKAGGDIPLFTPEIQQTIRIKLNACETRLNELFPSAMQPDRKNIATSTRFMNTPEFFGEAILGGNETPKTFKRLFEVITQTFETMGLRSFDGKTVMIHTTIYKSGNEPRQATEQEAFEIARHEITHGKVEPKITSISPTQQERKTGAKIVTLENGEVINVKHSCLYEAQTDALAIISSHPEVQSWADVFTIYLQERTNDNDEYAFQLSSLTRLLDYAFPDFSTGLTVLGESYFRCDSEGFIDTLSKGIKRQENIEMETEFATFVKCSEDDNASAMTESVSRLLKLKSQ